MKLTKLLSAAAIVSVFAATAATGYAQFVDARATGTTVTSVSGTIAQLNYGNDGEVEGFLIGTTTLLTFPSSICGGIATLGAVGNSVTYSGTEFTTTAGFNSVQVSSFTNNTTKVTYTHSTTNTPTAYGPTSGSVKQLNYDSDGSIDGFVFAPSGATISVFVSTGGNAGATLKPLLTVGATVSVTGTTSVSMSACTVTATLAAVDASSLTIGTQTIVLSNGNGGHPPMGGRH